MTALLGAAAAEPLTHPVTRLLLLHPPMLAPLPVVVAPSWGVGYQQTLPLPPPITTSSGPMTHPLSARVQPTPAMVGLVLCLEVPVLAPARHHSHRSPVFTCPLRQQGWRAVGPLAGAPHGYRCMAINPMKQALGVGVQGLQERGWRVACLAHRLAGTKAQVQGIVLERV
jgi:hypothetical protein